MSGHSHHLWQCGRHQHGFGTLGGAQHGYGAVWACCWRFSTSSGVAHAFRSADPLTDLAHCLGDIHEQYASASIRRIGLAHRYNEYCAIPCVTEPSNGKGGTMTTLRRQAVLLAERVPQRQQYHRRLQYLLIRWYSRAVRWQMARLKNWCCRDRHFCHVQRASDITAWDKSSVIPWDPTAYTSPFYWSMGTMTDLLCRMNWANSFRINKVAFLLAGAGVGAVG